MRFFIYQHVDRISITSYELFYSCVQMMQMYVWINQGMQASCFYEWIKMPYIDSTNTCTPISTCISCNKPDYIYDGWGHYRAFDAVNTLLKFTQREKTHSLLSHSDKVSSSSLFKSNIIIRFLKIINKNHLKNY